VLRLEAGVAAPLMDALFNQPSRGSPQGRPRCVLSLLRVFFSVPAGPRPVSLTHELSSLSLGELVPRAVDACPRGMDPLSHKGAQDLPGLRSAGVLTGVPSLIFSLASYLLSMGNHSRSKLERFFDTIRHPRARSNSGNSASSGSSPDSRGRSARGMSPARSNRRPRSPTHNRALSPTHNRALSPRAGSERQRGTYIVNGHLVTFIEPADLHDHLNLLHAFDQLRESVQQTKDHMVERALQTPQKRWHAFLTIAVYRFELWIQHHDELRNEKFPCTPPLDV
jgi:hypothetical protein